MNTIQNPPRGTHRGRAQRTIAQRRLTGQIAEVQAQINAIDANIAIGGCAG